LGHKWLREEKREFPRIIIAADEEPTLSFGLFYRVHRTSPA
jgi:hypothetical protein